MKEGWIYKKLGDFIEEYSVRDKGQGFPVYSVTNTRGFCQQFFGKNVASEDTSNYKVVPRGCFAYNPSRINVGSVACQNQEDNVSVSPLYVVFSVSPELRQDYLLYYIKSNYALTYINALARGAVRNNLRLSTLKEFDIPFGPLDEQKSIVCELDLLNETKEMQKAQLEELNKLAQSIFFDMFGDYADDTPVSEFISNLSGGKSLAGEMESENKVLKTGAVTFDYFNGSEVKNLPLDYSPLPEHLVKNGDVLVSRMNTPELVGSCAYVWEAPSNTYLPDRLWRASLKDNISPIYLWFSLIQLKAKEQIRNLATGSSGTMKNISKPKFMSVKIKGAPLALQQEFAAKIEAIEQMKAKVRQSLKESEELYNSRMDYYFN